jgi:XTP/dITP diphosphohydrolase
MNNTLVFATNNQHKAAEIQLLVGDAYEIKTLADIGCLEDIAETGSTLEENASIKSRYVYARYGLNCFADDTGLEVQALNGAPGVFSARYAGPQKNDEDNIRALLTNLKEHTHRYARFRTVISCILDGNETLFEGVLEGEITTTRSGANGFGYDPVFKPEGVERTLAEMSTAEKNEISHRAKATTKLIQFLGNQP